MTIKYFLVIAICFLTAAFKGFSQQSNRAFVGFGTGLDYGGFGLKAEYQPVPAVGIFGGFGFNLVDPGYNAGASLKIPVKGRVQPFFTAMYGYNAVIKIQDRRDLSKVYYGFTTGAGIDLFTVDNKNKWTFEILYPFRSNEFEDRYKELEDGGMQFKSKLLPVTFTIGYNFGFRNKKSE